MPIAVLIRGGCNSMRMARLMRLGIRFCRWREARNLIAAGRWADRAIRWRRR
ncbi:MAG: hypothetical protein N2483_03960 [Burkholderiaceae bacterium]|nr:hypothetical protein [Burkholderiaceae bacterium]